MIEVEVEDEAWRELGDVEALVASVAESALLPSPSREKASTVTVLLTGDAEVRALNARFRSRDAPTNVLSFPAADSARPHLGDIALAHGVCAREAGEQGKPLSDHLGHLVVHGVLHLLGCDHEADADAEAMEAMERDILARLGIADPYRRDGGLQDEPCWTGADAGP